MQADAGWGRQDTVPFLSCLEEQKLRFQGKDHFAALRGPSRLAVEELARPVSTAPVFAPTPVGRATLIGLSAGSLTATPGLGTAQADAFLGGPPKQQDDSTADQQPRTRLRTRTI